MKPTTLLMPGKLLGKLFLLVSTSLFSFGVISCSKTGTKTNSLLAVEATAASNQRGKPGGVPEMSLMMEVQVIGGEKITDDGGGAYTNGSQNVKVVFDQNGNLLFNSRASKNQNVAMQRWLNVNFDSPTASNTSPPLSGTERSAYLTSGSTTANAPFIPLQNMTVGTTQCIGLSGGLLNYDLTALNFHRNTEDNNTSETAHVYITRNSTTEWIMTSQRPVTGFCSDGSNVGAFVTNSGTLSFYYNLPFSIKLTKL